MMDIKENISLAKYTTFKIGGPAKYFCIARNKEDLIEAVKKAKELKMPFFILGGGSNVLALDKGFNGLVIKIHNSRFIIHNSNINAEAGTKLEDLVKLSTRESLTGMEWAAGIPGTVGGAVYGNAQAFDVKMSDIIKSVEIFDTKTLTPLEVSRFRDKHRKNKPLTGLKIKNLLKKQCQFLAKKSIFKKNKNLIILSVVLKTKKGDKEKIKKEIKEHLDYRKKNHPWRFPSAGSVFVNKTGGPPSAHLIEKCGLKGTKIGRAKVSEKHAGFIVNTGKAKAEDVLKLIKVIKQKVKRKFGVVLEEEIQIIY